MFSFHSIDLSVFETEMTVSEILFSNTDKQGDKHYSEWIHVWNELSQTAGHALGYANMVGHTPDLVDLSQVNVSTPDASTVVKGKVLYIPLQFFFCRNAGLALPLIA